MILSPDYRDDDGYEQMPAALSLYTRVGRKSGNYPVLNRLIWTGVHGIQLYRTPGISPHDDEYDLTQD